MRHEAVSARRRHGSARASQSAYGPAEGQTIVHDPTSEAADWVVRLAREDAGEGDWLAFAAWLDAAPRETPHLHRDAFDRAQRLWLQADGLAAVQRASGAKVGQRRRGGGLAIGFGLAAAAGLAAVIVAPWFNALAPTHGPAAPTVYATAPGHHRTVVLSDGSRVALDGATALALGPMNRSARSVALLHGEAVFDIVHDPARPFTVALGDAQVRVLGTAFDILRAPGLVQVSVSRGLVAVDSPVGDARLTAGRSAVLANATLKVRDVEIAEIGGWRTGRRAYWDTPLAVVVADLDRTYPQPIRLGDAAAGRLRFTGAIAPGTREQTVRRLTALLPLQATTAANGAIVLSSTRH